MILDQNAYSSKCYAYGPGGVKGDQREPRHTNTTFTSMPQKTTQGGQSE